MSKLNKAEKKERKELIERFGPSLKIRFSEGYTTTVIWVATCKGNGNISWVVRSKNDKQNRKRGELIALRRFNCGIYLPMTESIFLDTFN